MISLVETFSFFPSGWCWENQSDSLPLSSSAVKSQIRHNNSVLLKDAPERCRQLGVPIMKFALCLQDCFIDINGLLYPNDRAAGSSAVVFMGPLVLFLGPWKRPAVRDHDSVSGGGRWQCCPLQGESHPASATSLFCPSPQSPHASRTTLIRASLRPAVGELVLRWTPRPVASCRGWMGIQCSHSVCAC